MYRVNPSCEVNQNLVKAKSAFVLSFCRCVLCACDLLIVSHRGPPRPLRAAAAGAR